MATSNKKTTLDLSGTTFGAGVSKDKLLELNTGTQSNVDLNVKVEQDKQVIQAKGSTIVGKGHSQFWDSVLSHNYTDGTLQAMVTRARAPDEADPNFTLARRSQMIDNINASRQAQGKPLLSKEQTDPLLGTESEAQFNYFWTHMQAVEDERKWQQSNSTGLEIASQLTAGFGDITSVLGMVAGAGAANAVKAVGAGSKAVSAVDFGTDVAVGIAGSRLASATAGEDHGLNEDIMAAGTAVAFKGIVDAGLGTAKLLSDRYKARQEALALQNNPIETAVSQEDVPAEVDKVVETPSLVKQEEILRAEQDPSNATPVETAGGQVPVVNEDNIPTLTEEVPATTTQAIDEANIPTLTEEVPATSVVEPDPSTVAKIQQAMEVDTPVSEVDTPTPEVAPVEANTPETAPVETPVAEVPVAESVAEIQQPVILNTPIENIDPGLTPAELEANSVRIAYTSLKQFTPKGMTVGEFMHTPAGMEILNSINTNLKAVSQSPRVSPKSEDPGYALALNRKLREVRPKDMKLSEFLATYEGKMALFKAEAELDLEYFKAEVKEMPDDFILKQDDLVDSYKIVEEPEQTVEVIKEFGEGKITTQELVEHVEAHSTPEAAEMVVKMVNKEDVTMTPEDIVNMRLFRQYIPEGRTVADYINTDAGKKLFSTLRDEIDNARVSQESILSMDANSPEALLMKELLERERYPSMSLSQIDRLTIPDTIRVMQDVVSNPRYAKLTEEEKLLVETNRVDVYRIDEATGKRIKQRFTLVSPLQHALFYANRSGSGPITGKRRLAIDYIQKHYPQLTDVQVEQVARAFRLELQRPDYRFNAERAIREREVMLAAVTPEKLRNNPALREAIGEDATRYKYAVEALTTRVVADPSDPSFNRTSAELMRIFRPDAQTGRRPIDLYTEQAEFTLGRIEEQLKTLGKKKSLADEDKTAVAVLELAKERWSQIKENNFSDFAIRMRDFAERAFGPDSTVSPGQYDAIMNTYTETANVQRALKYERSSIQHRTMNMPTRERQGSRLVDPNDQYSLGTTFISGSTASKAEVLKMLYNSTKVPFIDSLVKAGKIKVVESPKDITHGNHPEDVLGMYDRKTDTTYVVAGNLTSAAQLDTLLMHEATHAELPKILGKKAYRELMDTAFVSKDFRQYKQEVIETYGLDPFTQRDIISEEILARAVENYGGSHPITASLLSAFKAWLYKIFGGNIIKLSQADLAHIVARSLRKQSKEAYIKYIDGPSIFDEVPKGHDDYELYSLVSGINKVASALKQSNNPPIHIGNDVGIAQNAKSILSNLVYQMETSANPMVRLSGKMLFTNRDTGTIGATEVHRRVTREAKATIQSGYAKMFDKYREEQGVKFVSFHTPEAIAQHKEFANDIGKTALLKATSSSDPINNAVSFTYSQLKRVQDMVVAERQAVEKVLGKQLEQDDPLAEFGDQLLDPDYIPTKINTEKLEMLRAKLDDDNAIVAFIAEAINAPGMSPREKRTYSAALFKALINSSNPDTRRAVDSMFSGASNTAQVMKLTGLYSKAEIDAIQNMQLTARRSSKPLLNANHSETINNETISLIDILETDVNVLLDSFVTPRVSAITLGQSLRSGITSLDMPYSNTMPAYIYDVGGVAHLNLNHVAAQDFLKTLTAESIVKDPTGIHERQMEILDNSIRLLTGGEFDDSTTGMGHDFLGVLSNTANVAGGWGFTLSLIPEFTKTLGGIAKSEAFKTWIGDISNMFKDGAGKWDNEMARDVADYLGVGFDASALPKYDSQAGTDALKNAQNITSLAVKGTFKMSGFSNLNDYNQYLAVRAHLSQMKKLYMTQEAIKPEIKQHMVLNGIPEAKIPRALEYVAHMYDEGAGKLRKSNKGFEDVDVFVKSYLNLVGLLAKSEAPMGSMPMMAYSKAAKIFMQYRSSIISSFVVNTIHDTKHFNRATATSWMFQFVGGVMSYMAASILRYHSDDKKLKEALKAENILKQAYGRASFAGLVPLIADAAAVMTGFKPIFSGAQYRDTFTFTPPALRTIADVVSGVAGISKTINPLSDDPNTLERNTALKMFGAAPLLSYGMGPVIFGNGENK